LYKPNGKVLKDVLDALDIEMSKNMKIVKLVDEALEGIDIPITLSFCAKDNERKLIEVLMNSREKKIGFILGNEYRDVLIELIRSRSFIEIRIRAS
jgi:hypothetical protein